MEPEIFRAAEFAVRAHAGQYRKSTRIPYIVHPMAVAQLLLEHGGSTELGMAGMLHDTVEDAGITLEQLRSEFGPRVAQLVEAASEPDKSAPWEERKRHTLHLLEQTSDHEVLWLCCADKLDNLGSIRRDLTRVGDAIWNRFNRGRALQEWYFRGLSGVFLERLGGQSPLATALEAEVRAVFDARP